MAKIDITDAETLKELIVDPVAKRLEDKVDAAIKPMMDRLNTHSVDINRLKSKWGKVLVGFAVGSLIFGGLIYAVADKIVGMIHVH